MRDYQQEFRDLLSSIDEDDLDHISLPLSLKRTDWIKRQFRFSFTKRCFAKLILRIKRLHFVNDADYEILEAIERMFIFGSSDEYGYAFLRQIFFIFTTMTTFRVIFIIVEYIAQYTILDPERIRTVQDLSSFPAVSDFHTYIGGLFFTMFFLMLHLETRQASVIIPLLTILAFLLGIW